MNVCTSMDFQHLEQTPLVRFLGRCDDSMIRESRTSRERKSLNLSPRCDPRRSFSHAFLLLLSLSLPRERSLFRALEALKNAPNRYFSHPRWRSSLTTLLVGTVNRRSLPLPPPPPQSDNYRRRGGHECVTMINL